MCDKAWKSLNVERRSLNVVLDVGEAIEADAADDVSFLRRLSMEKFADVGWGKNFWRTSKSGDAMSSDVEGEDSWSDISIVTF